MSLGSMHRLVEDTICCRRMHRDSSCFTWNIAGMELRQAPAAVLSVIEETVRTVVVPSLDLPEDDRVAKNRAALIDLLGRADGVGDKTSHEFPGLTEVFGAYVVIGLRDDPRRVSEFLFGLPARPLAQAVGATTIYFGHANGPESVLTAPTTELFTFLAKAADSDNEAVRLAAQRSLEFIRRPPRSQRRIKSSRDKTMKPPPEGPNQNE